MTTDLFQLMIEFQHIVFNNNVTLETPSFSLKPLRYLLLLVGAIVLFFIGFLTNFRPYDDQIYNVQSDVFPDVIYIPNSETEDVSLYLVFPFGEADNPYEQGLAHYIEHLAWLSAFGWGDGDSTSHSNAWTNLFTTGYWQKSHSETLVHDLKTLTKVAEPLTIDTTFALEERDILQREYEYRVAERPLYNLYQSINQRLYGTGTLARSVIGTPSDISQFKLENAKNLHARTHVLSQATLLVYGGVTKERLEASITSLNGTPFVFQRFEGKQKVERGTLIDDATVSVPKIVDSLFIYAKLVPRRLDIDPVKEAVLANLASNAIDSSLPGGLAGPLRYDQFIAREYSFRLNILSPDYIEILFEALPDNGASLDDVQRVFLETFNNTLKDGLAKETLGRILDREKGRLNAVLARDIPAFNRDLVLGQLMQTAPIYSHNDQLNALHEITLEDVNAFLKNLSADGRNVTRKVIAESK